MQSSVAQLEACLPKRQAPAWQDELALGAARQKVLEEDNEQLGRLLERAEEKAGLLEAERDCRGREKTALEEQLQQMRYTAGAARGDAKRRDRYYRLALERERSLKKEVARLKNELYQQEQAVGKEKESLQRRIEHLEWELRRKDEELEGVHAKLRCCQQQLFGRKTEKSEQAEKAGAGTHPETCTRRRRRGKRRGQKGHGRQIPQNLPEVVIPVAVPAEQCTCPQCGLPYEEINSTEDSVEIHWEFRLVKRIYKRQKCRKKCRCSNVPVIVTAPVPPKVIPKGMFSTGFWVQLLTEKYHLQRPLHKILDGLMLQGLEAGAGTLTGGLEKILGLVDPIYTRILERSRLASHWHMDETRWMVYVEIEGKDGYRWWLWVCVTDEVCVFILDPSRSAEVPKNHLADCEGILSVDRYSAYKVLVKGEQKIVLSYCWSHVRRDFKNAATGHEELQGWAREWQGRIGTMYHRNKLRLMVARDSGEFRRRDTALRNHMARIEGWRDEELRDQTLHPAKRKVLESMKNHWPGLMVFVEHPDVPPDNNEAERRLRPPVVGRKNYYGSGAVWSGRLAAALFSILQTFLKWDLNPKCFLQAYLDACAENGGKVPEDIDRFLPWNLSDETRRQWALHPT